jgi:phenylalanine ammonia-lyase
VVINGHTLSIPAVTAVARHNAPVTLDESPAVKDRVLQSRNAITSKVEAGISIYGLTTGFGGSGSSFQNFNPVQI